MPIAARLDELGKPAWIALVILGFFVWWPVGLATLAFAIGSGRMGCGYGRGHWDRKMSRMQEKMDRFARGAGGGWGGSGNRAFDDYRAETLRRLEEEQREFHDFLHRLRFARDKSEFDQFMAERRSQDQAKPSSSQG